VSQYWLDRERDAFDCDVPEITIMAHDGDDMAPTKRIDEPGDDGIKSA
jgi:hypothetical protein